MNVNQTQSVPLVCQVFYDKTVAALTTLSTKLNINEGAIVFIRLVTNWFKMMNVKDRYPCIRFKDDLRSPWTLGCDSFGRLSNMCDVIKSCAWEGGRGRKMKLTKMTASAVITTTKTNIEAATFLLSEMNFKYVLQAVFADEALEKFFGQTRQRSGGNFYIDVGDVMAAAKTFNLHNLLKNDLLPAESAQSNCLACTADLDENDLDSLHEISLLDTQNVITSDDTLKHKIVYIAGHLVHKYGKDLDGSNEEENITTEFLTELSRGGLSVPTLSTVHFVHVAYMTYPKVSSGGLCKNYLKRLFSEIDCPMSKISDACSTLSNIILKAFVLNNSDKEKALGCLRRQEKLSK